MLIWPQNSEGRQLRCFYVLNRVPERTGDTDERHGEMPRLVSGSNGKRVTGYACIEKRGRRGCGSPIRATDLVRKERNR